ncbi:MAG: hypothetical protein WCF01_11405 [Nitrososphaeraceae archaeon]
MSNHVNVNWHGALKKRARGIDADLGKVEEVDTNHIITRKGLVWKHKFYLPKKIVEKMDENRILFNVTEDEAEIYKF